MSYGFDSRIRYSQVGLDLKLTLGAVIDYFQDCSIFHSEAVGNGIMPLEEKHRAWMLSSWQIVIERFPSLGEQVRVETWPYDFKGFYGSRNFSMKDESGKPMIYANSLWIYMDTENGRPIRIDEKEAGRYLLEEKLAMDYAPRKMALPKNLQEQEGFQVMKHQLDTNHHVNNAQYIKMAEEYLPEEFVYSQMRAEYKKEAKLHDRVVPEVAYSPEGITVVLSNGEGQVYAVVAFDKEKYKN